LAKVFGGRDLEMEGRRGSSGCGKPRRTAEIPKPRGAERAHLRIPTDHLVRSCTSRSRSWSGRFGPKPVWGEGDEWGRGDVGTSIRANHDVLMARLARHWRATPTGTPSAGVGPCASRPASVRSGAVSRAIGRTFFIGRRGCMSRRPCATAWAWPVLLLSVGMH